MNYTLPNKLKLFAIILMVLGAVGIGAGFLSAPGSTAEVKQMMAHMVMITVRPLTRVTTQSKTAMVMLLMEPLMTLQTNRNI